MGVIYVITNTVNGKRYVGKTLATVQHRWGQHKASSRTGKQYLYRAMRKHGIENFTVEVIDSAETHEELLQKEMRWIAELRTTVRTIGYNSTFGGESGVPTPETLEKMRGRPCSPETREKIAAAQRGRKLPTERIEKTRAGLIGKRQRREFVEKRREANRKVWQDPDRKARQAKVSSKRLKDTGRRLWELRTPESLARAEESRRRWRATPAGQEFLASLKGRNNTTTESAKKAWETRRSNPETMQRISERSKAVRNAWWSVPENREMMREKNRANTLAFNASFAGIVARVKAQRTRRENSGKPHPVVRLLEVA